MGSLQPVRTLLAAAVLSICAAENAAAMNSVSAAALLASASLGASAVTNCNDSGPGSLRAAVLSAEDTDIINIPMLSCTLTLTTGELQSSAPHLTIIGPPSRFHIDQSGPERVISSLGSGSYLTLKNLYMTNGNSMGPGGGCIFAFGNVSLVDSKVSGCRVTSPGDARGGAIYAVGNAQLSGSEVFQNTATSNNGQVRGGGIWADSVSIVDSGTSSSIIEQNRAISGSGAVTEGGGIFATTNAFVGYSHISGNEATQGAGIFSDGICTIHETVISGNKNALSAGGAYCHGSTIVVDSTITGNEVTATIAPGGLFVYSGEIDIHNSIIAQNITATGVAAVDVAANAHIPLNPSNNIIGATNLSLPNDTIRSDPKLDPVSSYPTAASPALRSGGTNTFFSLLLDIDNNARTESNVDIGAYQESLFKGDFQ